MTLRLGPLSISFSLRYWRYFYPKGQHYGRFRNLPHVRPGRWGWYWRGIEFGNRNPGSKFGTWLKEKGYWPW